MYTRIRSTFYGGQHGDRDFRRGKQKSRGRIGQQLSTDEEKKRGVDDAVKRDHASMKTLKTLPTARPSDRKKQTLKVSFDLLSANGGPSTAPS